MNLHVLENLHAPPIHVVLDVNIRVISMEMIEMDMAGDDPANEFLFKNGSFLMRRNENFYLEAKISDSD